MFKPLAMQHVELSLLKDDAAQAALLLANYGAFDPEILEIAADQLPEAPGEAYRQAYAQCRAHLDKILAHFEISAPDTVGAPMQPVRSDRRRSAPGGAGRSLSPGLCSMPRASR